MVVIQQWTSIYLKHAGLFTSFQASIVNTQHHQLWLISAFLLFALKKKQVLLYVYSTGLTIIGPSLSFHFCPHPLFASVISIQHTTLATLTYFVVLIKARLDFHLVHLVPKLQHQAHLALAPPPQLPQGFQIRYYELVQYDFIKRTCIMQ